MFNRFTNRARQVVILAKGEADRFNHSYVGTEHLLLGLIKLGQGIAVNVLRKMGVDFEVVRNEISKAVPAGPEIKQIGELPMTSGAKKVIEYAVEDAQKLGHSYVGTEHLLLGLLREEEGIAARILSNLNVDINKAREEILNELGAAFGNDQMGPSSLGAPSGEQGASSKKTDTPALKAFGRDLTALAKEGKLDPVIGRITEIERVVQILCRRTKNNPVLIGEAGVGKTAIVEGLAQEIVKGNVPDILREKRLITMDLALMVAGTKYRGQFEERIKAVMDEIRKTKTVLLFIDELHMLVGAGAAEGAVDASNILKPALARGELQCIGATTFDEYRKYIEKDSALERRFQTINVEAPTVDETTDILKGLQKKYENHHNAVYTPKAIRASAELSNRYINGRFLPDKAIDVMDEAGARARINAMTRPPDLKKIELQISEAKQHKEIAITSQEYEKAAAMRDKERNLRKEMEETLKNWRNEKEKNPVVIDEDDIVHVISKWTGVPLAQLESKEAERLMKMEEELSKKIIGQNEAVANVSKALRRARANLHNPNRPIGSFLFLGPTGVGKTFLAKKLAEFIFGEKDALITLDMSEFMEKFTVSRLTGSPPGYVGHEEGGQLTEKVRRRPYSIVLFDEIEKAHPDVMDIFLQILDEGKLTDSLGRRVDFRNTILIMTSNIGTAKIQKGNKMGFGNANRDLSFDEMKSEIQKEVKKFFKPEFVNRIDDIIISSPLERDSLLKIVDIELEPLMERLLDKNITLEIDHSVKEFLIDKGSDAALGARPLK
ncbi:MAG: ATP-dependent Clp protease ATP-binding subunit, partial [Candidatus Aureabacteria bacterium]|nr:ATP-dependent Clp protease ATP-binding subunit [Candidatus Auribacterota bacterium]